MRTRPADLPDVSLRLLEIFAAMMRCTTTVETAEFLGARWSFLTSDGLAHLFLPALNLALFKTSLILRLTRAGVQEVVRTGSCWSTSSRT